MNAVVLIRHGKTFPWIWSSLHLSPQSSQRHGFPQRLKNFLLEKILPDCWTSELSLLERCTIAAKPPSASDMEGSEDMRPTASDMEGSEDMLPTASDLEGSEDMLPTASD